MAKIWKEKDNIFLKENYLKHSNKELADMFDVTKKSIQGKLRRLGLHRKDDIAAENEVAVESLTDEIEIEEVEEKPIFRRKRLSVDIPEVHASPAPYVPYVKQEMTDKRKRAMREFNNTMTVLSSGNTAKALDEFKFIIDNFPRELDIIQKADMWIQLLNRKPEAEPKTADEMYIAGIKHSQKNRLEAALNYFSKALELEPEYLDARYNIACIKCKNGEFQEAIQSLREIAQEDERFIETATQDEDFEPIWENEEFIELALQYIDLEEEEQE